MQDAQEEHDQMKLNETRDVRAQGWKLVLAAFAVAAILPVAAFAEEASPADKANGSRACQALKTSLTPAIFASTYGTNADRSNAFGKCVSQWAQAEHRNRVEALAACKAEQADATFAASHGGKSFAQFYGSGKHGANAFNHCVQSKRAAESAEEKAAVENAARRCKAERKSLGADPFKAKYGGKPNAFGKCVSKLARA
jgi:hypothetical protein